MPRRQAITLLSSLLLLGLTSCGLRVSQCQQLIDTLSEGQAFSLEYEQDSEASLARFSCAQNLPVLKAAAADNMSIFQMASARSCLLAQDIASLELEVEQLQEYQTQYTAVRTQQSAALTTAKDATQLLAEVESEEAFREDFGRFQAQTDSAYSALQSIDAEESQLIDGINAYCESPAQ